MSKKTEATVAASTEALPLPGVTIDVSANTAQEGVANGATKAAPNAGDAVVHAVNQAASSGKSVKVEVSTDVLADLLRQNGFKDEARRLASSGKMEGIRNAIRGGMDTNIKVRHIITVGVVAGVGALIYWAGKKYVMPALFGKKLDETDAAAV